MFLYHLEKKVLNSITYSFNDGIEFDDIENIKQLLSKSFST